MMGAFSSSFTYYVLICSIFVTSISELYSSAYLSGAFQPNGGCLRAGLLFLGLCTSPTLAGLVPDVDLCLPLSVP